MLNPFIIDEIRRLKKEKSQQEQPQLELELPRLIPRVQQEPEDERGLFRIDLL